MSPSPLFANINSAQSRTQTAAPATPLAHKKRTMSITQTYFLAHKARGKLSTEASRADHNLRLLVGHANLLDSLMVELAAAEREQESWFNQSLRGAAAAAATTNTSTTTTTTTTAAAAQQDRHMQWADSVEEPGADWQAEDADSDDSDSDSDMDEDEYEDVEMADLAATAGPEQLDDEMSYAHLTLTRSPSHATSPPELDLDSDSSDDEAMPPSPPVTALPAFSEQQKESMATSGFYDSTQEDKDAFYDEGFYLPARNPARLITAISVY